MTDTPPVVDLPATTRAGTTPAPRKPRSRWSVALRTLAQVLTIGMIVYVTKEALPEIRSATQAVADATLGLLALAAVCEAGAVLSLPQVYRASLAVVDRDLTYRRTLSLTMGAFTLGRVLPGGGLAGAVYATRRMTLAGIEGPAAAVAVGIQGVGQMASLGFLVAIVSTGAALRGDVAGPVLGLVAALAALVAVVPTVLSRLLQGDRVRVGLDRLVRRVAGQDRADRWLAGVDDVVAVQIRGHEMLRIGLWAALNWLFDFAALWLVLMALGGTAKAGELMLGFGVANLLTGLPHLPGGLGAVETGMAGTFVAVGVDTATAIATVLVYRVFSYWLPVIAGSFVLLRNRAGIRQNGPQ